MVIAGNFFLRAMKYVYAFLNHVFFLLKYWLQINELCAFFPPVISGMNIPYGEDTADFLLFFDKLFDSCNGSGGVPRSGKRPCKSKKSKNLMKSAIHSHSKHLSFWKQAETVLSSIKFINNKGKTFVP